MNVPLKCFRLWCIKTLETLFYQLQLGSVPCNTRGHRKQNIGPQRIASTFVCRSIHCCMSPQCFFHVSLVVWLHVASIANRWWVRTKCTFDYLCAFHQCNVCLQGCHSTAVGFRNPTCVRIWLWFFSLLCFSLLWWHCANASKNKTTNVAPQILTLIKRQQQQTTLHQHACVRAASEHVNACACFQATDKNN